MRHMLIIAACTALAVPTGLAGEDRTPDLFEAGLALGEAGGGVTLQQLAAAGSLPDEFFAGVAAGLIGRDRLLTLLTGQGTAPASTCGALAPAGAAAAPVEANPRPVSPSAAGPEGFGGDSFWIRLGDGSTPGVFMLADPACPYSAKALEALAPEISAGRLHVRLALAPVLSPASRDLAAWIMLDPQPAMAAWSMLLTSAGGAGFPPAQGSADQLGELGDALIAANLDWMRQRGLSAVPHFIWSSNGRWEQLTGLQDPAVFAAADPLVDGELAMHAPPWIQAMVEAAAMSEAPPLPGLPGHE